MMMKTRQVSFCGCSFEIRESGSVVVSDYIYTIRIVYADCIYFDSSTETSVKPVRNHFLISGIDGVCDGDGAIKQTHTQSNGGVRQVGLSNYA